jgi:hypothetical protein
MPSIERHTFKNCRVDDDLNGILFADCEFEHCQWHDNGLVNTFFDGCMFNNCSFNKGTWVHTGFRETTFSNCTFSDVYAEALTLIGTHFIDTAWICASLVNSNFEHCTFTRTAFTEAALHASFRDCTICAGAFDHLVEGESSIHIYPEEKSAHASPMHATGEQDHLYEYAVEKGPTLAQLAELDRLIETETDEKFFQAFLERNVELISIVCDLGHHGLYVLPQVAFGNKHRADFMIGAKNSMGYQWTGLEIESPRHAITRADGHFTAQTEHAINQVRDWRRYVRNNRATVQLPRSQGGEGLAQIEPEFDAWIIIGLGRDENATRERRDRFIETDGTIHVQTWHGFRDRIEFAIRRRGAL